MRTAAAHSRSDAPSGGAQTIPSTWVSPEMALRLGRFFGKGTEIWVNLQARYDHWEIERDPRALREAERVEPVHA